MLDLLQRGELDKSARQTALNSAHCVLSMMRDAVSGNKQQQQQQQH